MRIADRGVSRAAAWGLGSALLALVLVGITSSPPVVAQDGPAKRQRRAKRTDDRPALSYAYDAAGRLARVADGSGRVLEYTYDAGGNLTSRQARTVYAVQVKKPAKGAWYLSVAGDGAVRGFGADDTLGTFDVAGNFEVDPDAGTATGALRLLEPGSDTELLAFALDRVKVKAKGGELRKVVLRTTDGLKGLVLPTSDALVGFSGLFGSDKNQAREGSTRTTLDPVSFVADAARGEASVLGGGLEGLLVRDAKGRAWGTIDLDGPLVVSGKLKSGGKKVVLKATRASGRKVKVQVRR